MRVALTTGRLEQPAWGWLEALGLASGGRADRSLFWSPRPSLEVALVRGRDIPALLQQGAVDIGLVGRDVVEEADAGLWLSQSLGFGVCRLVFAVPDGVLPDPRQRIRIATRYPGITRRWARMQGREVDLVPLQGSVEVAPALGLADAVVDIVETGRTLRSNGLFPVEVLLESYAGLATRPGEEALASELVEMLPAQASARRGGIGLAAGNP